MCAVEVSLLQLFLFLLATAQLCMKAGPFRESDLNQNMPSQQLLPQRGCCIRGTKKRLCPQPTAGAVNEGTLCGDGRAGTTKMKLVTDSDFKEFQSGKRDKYMNIYNVR